MEHYQKDDVQLCSEVAAGSAEAFGEIATRYTSLAYACAFAVLRQRDAAEDAAQEVMIRALVLLRGGETIRSNGGSIIPE